MYKYRRKREEAEYRRKWVRIHQIDSKRCINMFYKIHFVVGLCCWYLSFIKNWLKSQIYTPNQKNVPNKKSAVASKMEDLNSEFETKKRKGETVSTVEYDEANFPNKNQKICAYYVRNVELTFWNRNQLPVASENSFGFRNQSLQLISMLKGILRLN